MIYITIYAIVGIIHAIIGYRLSTLKDNFWITGLVMITITMIWPYFLLIHLTKKHG